MVQGMMASPSVSNRCGIPNPGMSAFVHIAACRKPGKLVRFGFVYKPAEVAAGVMSEDPERSHFFL